MEEEQEVVMAVALLSVKVAVPVAVVANSSVSTALGHGGSR